MSNININELSTRDQNELSSSKILFWNFIKELYLPDKPFSFYIKLVNQINKEILINENFRELVKNEIFSKFFNAILHYIFKELDKKPLFPLANEEDFVNLRDFLQIYQHSSLSLLDEMHKNNVFPLLNHKEQHFILTPAYIEQNMKIIHFFVGLERKKIRKEFKNIETYEEFSKETLEFLKENKDSDQIFEISNFFFNGTCKWIKKVMFLKDIDVKAKALVRIIVILEQFIIDNKKEIKRNLKCFEILRSHSFVELKKTLKLRFWSRFQENSLEKPKAYDENYQKNMFVVPFLELYDVIKEFLDNNFGIFILEMSFLIYIKTLTRFIFVTKKIFSQMECLSFLKSCEFCIRETLGKRNEIRNTKSFGFLKIMKKIFLVMLEKKQFNEEVDLSEKQKLAIRNLRSKDFFKENHEIAKKVKGLFL